MSCDCNCSVKIVTIGLTHWKDNWKFKLFDVCIKKICIHREWILMNIHNRVILKDNRFHWETAGLWRMLLCTVFSFPCACKSTKRKLGIYTCKCWPNAQFYFLFLIRLIHFWTPEVHLFIWYLYGIRVKIQYLVKHGFVRRHMFSNHKSKAVVYYL